MVTSTVRDPMEVATGDNIILVESTSLPSTKNRFTCWLWVPDSWVHPNTASSAAYAFEHDIFSLFAPLSIWNSEHCPLVENPSRPHCFLLFISEWIAVTNFLPWSSQSDASPAGRWSETSGKPIWDFCRPNTQKGKWKAFLVARFQKTETVLCVGEKKYLELLEGLQSNRCLILNCGKKGSVGIQVHLELFFAVMHWMRWDWNGTVADECCWLMWI